MSVPEVSPTLQRAPRYDRPAIAFGVALVVGAVATAVGAGVGLRHLQKVGLTTQTVGGLLLLAGGLVLLGFAGKIAWKALRGWARLLLLPAAVVVLVVTFAGAVAVMVTVVPPTALGTQTPADRGMDYRDVTFTTSDGAPLSAWLVPSRNGAAVILRHGSGSTRTAVLPQAEVLARHGYGLLLLDARGHGRSGGRGMDLGWYGEEDITAAVTYLVRRAEVDAGRVGLLGLSMGGEEAIGAAAADDRIRVVVAEGATGRTAADREGWLPGGVAGAIQRRLDWLTFSLVELLTPAAPPTALHDAVAAADGTSFLLIAAGMVPDESRAASHIRSTSPDRVEVWTVAGATHTHALNEEPEDWEQRVVGFLDAQLQPDT
jgi:uncharacterized protein